MPTTKTKKNTEEKKEKAPKVAKKEVAEPKVKKVKELKDEIKNDKKKVKSHPLLKGARITEKSALLADKGIYTFNVAPNANKSEIKKAIKMVYSVTPVKIAITQITEKKVFIRGNKGVKQGGKKAVVYLKKGDKIEFV